MLYVYMYMYVTCILQITQHTYLSSVFFFSPLSLSLSSILYNNDTQQWPRRRITVRSTKGNKKKGEEDEEGEKSILRLAMCTREEEMRMTTKKEAEDKPTRWSEPPRERPHSQHFSLLRALH